MDPAEFQDRMSRSIVWITILPPLTDPQAFKATRCNGIIIVLESNFAYVVAHPKYFVEKFGCRLRLRFPGHAVITFDAPEIHICPKVAGICCRYAAGYDTDLMEEVTFSLRQPSKSQEVYVYDPQSKRTTSGSIIGTSGRAFKNNCAADLKTRQGAVVLNNYGDMVGMCISFRNLHLTAISTNRIAYEIENSQGRHFTTIEETLQHLRSYNDL